MATEKRLINANDLPLGKFVEPRTEWHQGWNDALDAATTQAPTVDAVEVVHGRWVALDDDCEELENETEALRWGCTACHEIVEYDDWTHKSRLTRFCPNCGADMRGDGNGT